MDECSWNSFSTPYAGKTILLPGNARDAIINFGQKVSYFFVCSCNSIEAFDPLGHGINLRDDGIPDFSACKRNFFTMQSIHQHSKSCYRLKQPICLSIIETLYIYLGRIYLFSITFRQNRVSDEDNTLTKATFENFVIYADSEY